MKKINHTIVENLLINIRFFSKTLRINELKGNFILFFSLLVTQITVVGVLFYFLELVGFIRYGLVLVFSILNLFILLKWFIVPVLEMFYPKFSNSFERDVKRIGSGITEVDDKLSNSLELLKMENRTVFQEADLIYRAKELGQVEFNKALPQVDWRILINVLCFCLLLFFSVLIFNSDIFSVGITRFVNPQVSYSNSKLSLDVSQATYRVMKGGNLNLSVNVNGDNIPDEIFMKRNNVVARLAVVSGKCNIALSDIRSDQSLEFYYGNVKSNLVSVKVLERFEVFVDSIYFDNPLLNNDFNNISSIDSSVFRVLENSVVYYEVSVANGFLFNGKQHELFVDTAMGNQSYSIYVSDLLGDTHSVVIGTYEYKNDFPPEINIVLEDSLLKLSCSDDYGLKSLSYVSEQSDLKFEVEGRQYLAYFALSDILSWGKGRFVVCDVGIPCKCVESDVIQFDDDYKLIDEYLRINAFQSDEVMNRSNNEVSMDELRNRLYRQEELVNAVNQVVKVKEDSERANQLLELNKQLSKDDYEDLVKRMDSLDMVLDSDKIRKDIDELLRELDAREELINFNLELYRELEIQEKLQTMDKALEESIRLQDELLDNDAEVSDEVISLGIDLLEQGKVLDSLMNLDQNLEQSIRDINENLSQPKDKESQNRANDKSKELKDSLAKMLNSMNAGSKEDLDNLRNILEGLKLVSSMQEQNCNEFIRDPDQVLLLQQSLDDAFMIISDSLTSLALRVPLIGDKIFKEMKIVEVEKITFESNYAIGKRQPSSIALRKMLTAENELALLLDDVILNMEDQMAKEGTGQCSNPGNNPKPGKGLSKESLSKMLSRMKSLEENIAGGKNQGKSSDDNGNGAEGESKNLAEMIMLNQSLRKVVRDLYEDSKSKEVRTIGEELVHLLEEQEENIIQDGVNSGGLERHRISVKMLEMDNALKEQEYSSERESSDGEKLVSPYSNSLDNYLRTKKMELEALKLSILKLNTYYEEL